MAVATQTQVQFPGRSWDEEIVPALRKRLREESAALAKRMSGQSLHSSEEGQNLAMDAAASSIVSYANSSFHGVGSGSRRKPAAAMYDDSGYFDSVYPATGPTPDHARGSSSSGRPSGIPRPSFSTSPAEVVRTGHDGSVSNTPRPPKNRSRARTISTPQLFDNETLRGGTEDESTTPTQHRAHFQGTRVASRSGSPMPNGLLPSRIPRPNTQQSHHSPSSMTPDPNTIPPFQNDIAWPTSYNAATSTPDLLREPKGPQSVVATPRESMDEEGEYEHWYRGDVSRSGGVGEYKIAKRREMFDIANYGHLNPGPRSTTTSRPGSIIDPSFPNRVSRKRAGSMAERGSVYIEDESVTEWVIDELPLTDDDSAIFPDPSDPYGGIGVARTSARSPTPAGRKAIQIPPMPAFPDSVTNPSPGPVTRSFTSPIPLSHSQSQQQPQSQSTKLLVNGSKGNQNHAQNPNQKRVRVVSKPTQNKKPKAQTLSAADRGKGGLNVNVENERPVSSLLVDAIPSWSVPVAKDGNWDNVVLPVVARKMGLEGQFEEVDGANPPTPRNRLPAEQIHSPAPGTFGYDYSKYRPPRTDNFEMAPVGEFGTSGPGEPQMLPPSRTETPQRPPPSPTPFSRYSHTRPAVDNTRDTPMIRLHAGRNQAPPILLHPPTMNSMTEEKRRKLEEEEESSGCCKCVVM